MSNEANANGEFLLYSLALLSSAYTTSKYYKGGARISCIIILLIVTSILYTLITVLRENNSNLIEGETFIKPKITYSYIYTGKAEGS